MEAAVTYACPACGASTEAVVTGLDDPKDFVSDRDRRVLRQIDAVRTGSHAGDPVASIEQRLLDDLARSKLRFATCPRCGARNPEGIVAQAKDARGTLIAAAAIVVIGVPALYYAPWLTVVLGAANALIALLVARNLRRAGRPMPPHRLALNLAAAAVTAAVGLVVPRFAPALPVIGVIPTLLKNRRPPVDEGPWDEAKAAIRFEAVHE